MGFEFEVPTLARTPLAEQSRDQRNTQQLREEFVEDIGVERGGLLHPQLIEQPGKKYQVKFSRILPHMPPTPVNIDQKSLQIF